MRYYFRKYYYILYIVFFAAIVAASGILIITGRRGDVMINEICTSNVACCMDENGDYPDWIELYNPTDEEIDLSGYIVNKSADLNKEKFVIPDGTILASGSFYLFDPHFSISSEGCSVNLIDTGERYVDQVRTPKLKYDTTYARSEDGGGTWVIKQPSPGYSNDDEPENAAVADGYVTASADSGFYINEFDLKLRSTVWGRRIYYTTDGTDPRENGTQYDKPIHVYDKTVDENVYSTIPEVSHHYVDGDTSLPSYKVDKCMVVRTVAQDMLGRYTDESVYTYFVGYDAKKAYDNIAVVTITADPTDLYDHENGIMVLGHKYDEYLAAGEPEEYEDSKANFTIRGRKSEREVRIEIYDENHMPTLRTNAGIRIKGLSSRWDEQKSYSIIFRKAYGGNYRESFTVDGCDFDYHSIVLDKGGQDISRMKDNIMEECMSGTGCVTTDRVPCCLFLNGEYNGLYMLTQRFDRSFISDKYGVEKEDVELKDREEFENYDNWHPNDFDRDSIIDYYAANILVAHEGDWPEFNFRIWRTLTDEENEFGDGKWRPVIFDMNSVSMEDPEFESFEYMMERFYPFREFVADDENFRNDLVARVDEMCAGEFEQQKILGRIDEIYNRIHDQMILDRMRFMDCSSEEAEAFFDESVEIIRNFFINRYKYLNEYKDKFVNGE